MQIIAIVTPSKIPDACGGTPVSRSRSQRGGPRSENLGALQKIVMASPMIPQLDYAKPDLPRGGRGIAWTLAVLSIVAPLSSGWTAMHIARLVTGSRGVFFSANGVVANANLARFLVVYFSIAISMCFAAIASGVIARRYAKNRKIPAVSWVALVGISIASLLIGAAVVGGCVLLLS